MPELTYNRVIPRDLFNEANLLKCLGQLWICLETSGLSENRARMIGPEPGEQFRIIQDESDGSTYVENVRLLVFGKHWHLSRPINSREPWPLYVSGDDEEFAVFMDDGTLSPDFLSMLRKAKSCLN